MRRTLVMGSVVSAVLVASAPAWAVATGRGAVVTAPRPAALVASLQAVEGAVEAGTGGEAAVTEGPGAPATGDASAASADGPAAGAAVLDPGPAGDAGADAAVGSADVPETATSATTAPAATEQAGHASATTTVEPAAPARVLRPRDAAMVGAQGEYSVGVFNPLTYNILDGVALRSHPLLFFIAPHVVVEVSHGKVGPVRLKGEYGLSLPTPAMRLARGYLFPTWDKSDRQVGWFLVPRAGIVAS